MGIDCGQAPSCDCVDIRSAWIEIRKGWGEPDKTGPIPGDGPGSIELVLWRAITGVAMYKRTEITIYTAHRFYTIGTRDARASVYYLYKIQQGIAKSCGVPDWQA